MESESEKTRLKIEFTEESGMISAPILDSLLVDNSPSPPRYISGDPNEQNHHQDLPRNSDLTIKAEDLKEEPMETDMPDQAGTKTIFEQIMTDSETEDEKEAKLNDMGEGGVLIPIRWYKCEECLWARFQSIEDLFHHQMTTHKDNENKPSNHNFPARRRPRHFICPTCKREFRSGFELGLHLETKECVLLSISKNKKKSKAPEMAKKIEGGEWQCIRCIYKSRDKYNVIRHYKYGHYQQVDCFISKDKSLREIALKHNQLSKIREAEIDLEEEQKRVEKQKAQQKRKLERKQEQEALDKRREERERKKKEREAQMAEKRQKMEARKREREEKKRTQMSEKHSAEGFSEELKKQVSEENKEMLALKALKSKERAEKTLARKIAKEKLAEEKRIKKLRINEEKQRQLQEEKRQYMAILEEKKRVAQERYAKLLEEEKAQKLQNMQSRNASLSFNSSNNSGSVLFRLMLSISRKRKMKEP